MTTRYLYICLLLLVHSFTTYSHERDIALPLIYIETGGNSIDRDERTPATISIIYPSDKDSIMLSPHSIGIKVRGKSAAQYPKKSYSIEFVDTNQQETDVQLFGMRSDDDWILDAMYIDQARMRNRLCTDLWNAYNRIPHQNEEPTALNGTRGIFVEVVLNGEYNGLYCLTERIDRKQLKLKKYKNGHRGVSYKADTWDNIMGYCSYNPHAPMETLLWNGFESEYPGEVSNAGWEYLQEFLEFLSSDYTSDEFFATNINRYIHLDNLIDYTLLINALYALDNVVKNMYLNIYNVQSDQRMFFTPWDMDATLGRTYDGTLIDQYAFSGSVPFGNQLISRLWEGNVNNFRQTLTQRWNELRHTTLSPDSVAERIYAYQELLENSGAFAREQNRWPALCAKNLPEETAFMTTWYTRNVQVIDSTLAHIVSVQPPLDAQQPPLYTIVDHHLVINIPYTNVTLYSSHGEMLYNAFEHSLHNIELYSNGIYILRIDTIEGNVYTHKVCYMNR